VNQSQTTLNKHDEGLCCFCLRIIPVWGSRALCPVEIFACPTASAGTHDAYVRGVVASTHTRMVVAQGRTGQVFPACCQNRGCGATRGSELFTSTSRPSFLVGHQVASTAPMRRAGAIFICERVNAVLVSLVDKQSILHFFSSSTWPHTQVIGLASAVLARAHVHVRAHHGPTAASPRRTSPSVSQNSRPGSAPARAAGGDASAPRAASV
jgi:hypothetical protein